ncbi:MAG: ABC transporter ATP-binding protein [Firmicutes bacterium]|nr:ABC transporter ATP-binding protein [Bacillota bacterium]MDH7495615.1 ABC transporter ATP-binding protein [Bacillota bacterium]
MIEVAHVFHDYTGEGRYAVSDVSFTISKGEIFGFLGPSGAGKSTVQNIMTGLLRLQRGEVLYDGVSVRRLGRRFFNSIGVSFEHPNVYEKLSGYENLSYFAGLFDVPTQDPMKLLDMVGLREAAHRSAGSYSKGMKQRLVFVRALVNNPSILFLDEPTAGLDPSLAGRIKDIIRQKQREGCTVFLTTHNMFVADELCDRVAFLNEGRIVAMDSPRALKLRYGERSIKVEYRDGADMKTQVLFTERAEDRALLHELLERGRILTIHSREATLEQIFISLTGRELA